MGGRRPRAEREPDGVLSIPAKLVKDVVDEWLAAGKPDRPEERFRKLLVKVERGLRTVYRGLPAPTCRGFPRPSARSRTKRRGRDGETRGHGDTGTGETRGRGDGGTGGRGDADEVTPFGMISS